MKKLAFGALCIGLLTMAACGGGGDDPDARVIIRTDGGGDGGSDVCNILLNSGCATGQKCTWIRVSVSPPLGQIGCVPDGTVATNGACTYMAAGASTGYDNCAGGNICLASPIVDQAMGSCREICSLMDASAPCATDFACGSYYRFFSNSDTDTPLAGVCDPTCDPLSGTRDFDDAADCGGPPDPADPAARGCYGIPSNDASPTTFTCSSAGEGGHRTVLDPDNIFLNSCASGNVPLLYERSGSMQVVCIATCQPRDCNMVIGNGCHRGVDPYQTTDRGCTAAGEECKFLWWFEAQETPITAASDGIGFCVDYTKYQWDNDEDPGTPDVNWTACRNSRDIDDPNDPNVGLADWFWGCVSTAMLPAFAPQTLPRAASHGITIRPIGVEDIKRAGN